MAETRDPRPSAPARRRRRLPRLRWWVGALVLLLAAWAVAVAVQLVRADHQLRLGTAAAQQARSRLSTASLTDAATARTLAVASADFAAAHRDVGGLVAPLQAVPILGTQIRSLRDLSGSAQTVTGVGGQTLATARTLLDAPHRTPAQRTRVVEALSGALSRLDRTVTGLDLGPVKGLVGPLASKRDLFASDVDKLQAAVTKANGASYALADLLRGPRSELIVAANNAEMRAGTGMFLQTGSLKVSGGRFDLGAFRSVGSLRDPNSRVRPTGALATTWGFEKPQQDFRTLFLSPDAPANDSLAARMWKERTGQSVDGVIAVDVGALADLLGVTGPVTVGPMTYTAGNVTTQLLERQYVGLTGGSANDARREQLGALAAAVVQRLQQGGYSLTALVTALDRAVDGRHIVAWSATPKVEAAWSAAGAAGEVGPDNLMLGVLNLGGNKLDPYQQVTSSVSTARRGSATAFTVRVRVENATPSSVTGYAAGGPPSGPAPARTYVGAVSLSVPPEATGIRVQGPERLAIGPEGDAEQIAELFSLPDGHATTITIRFTLPGTHGRLVVLPSARLPASTWRVAGTAPFRDDTAHAFSW